MRNRFGIFLGVVALALAAGRLAADDLPEDYSCTFCHGKDGLLAGPEENRHLIVTPEDLAVDIHWKSDLRCHDCHGGAPKMDDFVEHRKDDGFRSLGSAADLPNFCGHCHSDAAYMRKYDAEARPNLVDSFLNSVHGKHVPKNPGEKIVNCNSCHLSHKMRGSNDMLSAIHPSNLTATCGACHQQQLSELKSDAHGRSDQTNPLGCVHCHLGDVHGTLAVDDPQSSVFVKSQVETCGRCHEPAYQEYRASVHGHGLEHSGLLTTAVCSSCHGAHGVYSPQDERSLLHVARVDSTCAACHRFIQEQLAKSVHGRGEGPGDSAAEVSPGGHSDRNPTCTDCHQGHDRPNPNSDRFRLRSSDSCGDCHDEQSHSYSMSLHGQLTDLGYEPAAKCSDCHGSHSIVPVSDPSSLVFADNRVATCKSCHLEAVENFGNYLVHADHHDADSNPVLHFTFLAMEILLYSVFGFFGIHTLLWFFRSLIDVIRNGRPRRLVPGTEAFVRFKPFHRTVHLIVIISFLGLALTGLPLKYSDFQWAKTVSYWLGGFESTSLWHHIFGIVTVAYLVIHVVWMLVTVLRKVRRGANAVGLVLGPDSPVPSRRDFSDMAGMFRWFFGGRSKPVFERWTYWEKFDYWAVFWGVAIIGISGFMLWSPNFFCRFLPGEAINLAKIIHSEEALLATGFIFAIHFFNTHFRPEKFPMDMSMMSGLVTEEEMREERPEYYERLQREGRLPELRSTVPAHRPLWFLWLGGTLALIVGLALLAGIVTAVVWG